MRTLASICCLCLGLAGAAFGQTLPGRIDPQHRPVLKPHAEPELTFDKPVDGERWRRQAPGLNVAFGSTDAAYFRSEVPEVSGEARSWEAAGWRGERLNATVLVWSPDALEQVRFEWSDLQDAEGHVLGRDRLRLRIVRYVVSDYPYGATAKDCASAPTEAWLLPDRLEDFERFDLPARSVRPVWLSLDIPADAAPGVYHGRVQVHSQKQRVTLRLTVTVQQPVLPPPHEWAFRLDLWQNPWVIAAHHGLRPWSDEHKALLKEHLMLYAQAGGKYVTTYAMHSPWQDNSYTLEGAMIEWIRAKDGAWRFDYRIFDTYVALAAEAGVDRAITLYTPIPWGHRFRYLDERTGNYVYATWPPDSAEFRKVWHRFLDSLQQHLEAKGWLQRTYLGINENPLEHTLAAIKVIKEHSPQWKITYAGDWHPELDRLVDDYSSAYGKEPGVREIEARTTAGFTSTYYVACFPPKPNTFIFSPPVEARWLGWYSAARGYDGFLRWAYDAWPADPMRDARHTLWPAGDCFLVYPGGESSIRFEKLREGIVDYEKIRLLRAWASQRTDTETTQLMTELDRHLETFTTERAFDEARLRDTLQRGEEMLEALSERLAH
jgi:hypothetical protein